MLFLLFFILTVASAQIVDLLPSWKTENLTEENLAIMNQKISRRQPMLDAVAYRGDALRDYRIGLRQLNLLTRENYAEMIDQVGHNIYPLLIANDVDHDKRLSGTGSEWILYMKNGTILRSKPAPAAYETNKDLAHMAMGVFSIISPYFNFPQSQQVNDKLIQYQKMVHKTLVSLEKSNLQNNYTRLCDVNLTVKDQKKMLSMTDDFITQCLKQQNVSFESYMNFTDSLMPYIYKALNCASQAQIRSTLPMLTKWKEMLGAEWENLYVVIPVIWPVARINPRRQMVEKLMSAENIKTNIIMAEGAKSVKEARVTLGRIVSDRVLSQFVFKNKTKSDVEHNLALSTKTDLVTPNAEEELAEKLDVLMFSVDQPNDLHDSSTD